MKSLVVAGMSLVLLLVSATQAAAGGRSSLDSRRAQTSLSYHWPIKPFDSQHPVRGAFGDPRIAGDSRPFGWTGPTEIGAHSFHNGIDIVAAPGTPVYPVVSGRVARAKSDEIVVHTDDGRGFQYYHLSRAPAVQRGRLVVADRTVLGWIRASYGHVHLAEIDHHHVHNPLDRGHLEPYHDRTRPVANDLYVDDGPVPSPIDGRSIGPDDHLAVAAKDRPPLSEPGPWLGRPQTPALVEWRLSSGRTNGKWKVAVDFRQTQPQPRDFWEVYGAGTYQNSPVFEHRLFSGTPGRYLFRIHVHPSRLQLDRLYELTVRVADVRGNRSTTSWPLEVTG